MEKHAYDVIELNEYYNGKGAVVSDSCDIGLLPFEVKRITPTPYQIRIAEEILKDDYFFYLKKDLFCGQWGVPPPRDTIRLFWESYKASMDRLQNNYRQYLGFVKMDGDTVVSISLLNFDTKTAREEFKNWRDEIYAFVTGDFIYENVSTYFVDINKVAIIEGNLWGVFRLN
jgi:hypothetical protein